MYTLVKSLFGLAMVVALAACSPKSDEPASTPSAQKPTASASDYATLFEQPFQQPDAVEADLDGLIAALPENVSLSWDAKRFDSDSGATVFEGLSLSYGDAHPFGARFDEARIWGLETGLLSARLNGQRLDEAGPVFTRLDGTNLTYFGVTAAVDALLETIFDQYLDDEPMLTQFGLDEFEFSTARLVMTNVSLRPWELVPAPRELVAEASEDEQEMLLELVHMGQQAVAIVRSLSYERGASRDGQGRIVIRQPYTVDTIEMSWDSHGYRDVSGFDIGEMVTRGGTSTQVTRYADEVDEDAVLVNPEATFLSGQSLSQAETYDLTRVSGLRLDTLMGYLARSELPGPEVRDLLSLGLWEIEGYSANFNDKQVVNAERASLRADTWAWIFPEVFTVEFDQATVHVEDIMVAGQTLAIGVLDQFRDDIEDPEEAAEYDLMLEGLDKTLELLPEHGLSEITFDFSSQMRWGADNGDTAWNLALEADGFGDTLLDIAVTLPTYEDARSVMQAEDKQQAASDVFERAFAFKGARFLERDRGGYDKILGFANAIGKEYSDQGWGAMLGSMEPAQMRSYLATMVRMGKSEAARDLPQAADWLEAYASYLEEGGTFEAKSAPPEPIDSEFVDAHEDPEPDEIVSFLGITVTHTK